MCKDRCVWVGEKNIYIIYHDEEWGVPVYDDNTLFEFLLLESFQAGLSWLTILEKRANFRLAFDNFDYQKIALYNTNKYNELLQNKGIIRNRLKISTTISNAQAFIGIQNEFGSFSKYIWRYVNNKPIQNQWKKKGDVPTKTPLSDRISNDLRKRGFKFVGSTIIYAYMQAIGMVNDHVISCFRYKELADF